MSDNNNIPGQENGADEAQQPDAGATPETGDAVEGPAAANASTPASVPVKNREPKIPAPRPVSITLYLMAFLGIFAIVYSFTGAYAPYGLFYPAANMLTIVGMFASFAGIGSMEKWGLWLFMVMLGLKLGLDVFTGAFSFWELGLLIPAGIFIAHAKKMS